MTRPQDKRIFLSKVNTPPVGLQDLLGNVNQGVNPHDLDHKISPGVDLYPHYTSNRLEIATASAEVAGITGQGVGIPIPEGQIWQPIALSAEYELQGTNADDTQFSVGVQRLGTGYYVPFHTSFDLNYPGTAGDFGVACGPTGQRFFVSGGWQFWAQVDAAVQTDVRTMTINVFYARLTD